MGPRTATALLNNDDLGSMIESCLRHNELAGTTCTLYLCARQPASYSYPCAPLAKGRVLRCVEQSKHVCEATNGKSRRQATQEDLICALVRFARRSEASGTAGKTEGEDESGARNASTGARLG